MANDKADKLKALKLTLDKLDKTYGKGTVMKMGDAPNENVEAFKQKANGETLNYKSPFYLHQDNPHFSLLFFYLYN